MKPHPPRPLPKYWRSASTLAGAVALIFLSRPAARAESGSELFVKYCALCHGKDGKATSPAARKLGVKDLSLSQATDAAIIQQITEGRQDERGNLKMPAFQEKLSAAEIQSLLPVVKAFRK